MFASIVVANILRVGGETDLGCLVAYTGPAAFTAPAANTLPATVADFVKRGRFASQPDW